MQINKCICDRCGKEINTDILNRVNLNIFGFKEDSEYDLCMSCKYELNDLMHKFIASGKNPTIKSTFTKLIYHDINDCVLVHKNELGSTKITNVDKNTPSHKSKKRKYFRKCGCCGERYEQSEMIRTDDSPNGWMCEECYNTDD